MYQTIKNTLYRPVGYALAFIAAYALPGCIGQENMVQKPAVPVTHQGSHEPGNPRIDMQRANFLADGVNEVEKASGAYSGLADQVERALKKIPDFKVRLNPEDMFELDMAHLNQEIKKKE